MKRSSWCLAAIKNDTDVFVNCKFHSDKNKWEPTTISKSKRPSYATDFLIKDIDS